MANFDQFFNQLMQAEGGYANNPFDRGGETFAGVSSKYFPRDVANLKLISQSGRDTTPYLRDFYKREFWDKSGAENVPEEMRLAYADTAVNSGIGTAKRMLGESGSLEDLLDNRQQFVNQIVANDPTQAEFQEGWENRIEGLRENPSITLSEDAGEGSFDLELPDGTILQGVPVGTSKAQITDMLSKQGYDVSLLQPEEMSASETAASKDDFFSRLQADLDKRTEQGLATQARDEAGEQSGLSTGIQQAGLAAGLGFDVMGNALTSGFRALPDIVENPIREGLSAIGGAVADSSVAEGIERSGLPALISRGVEGYQRFSEENPVAAANIGSLGNIAMMAAPVKAKPKAGSKGQSLFSRGAEKVSEGANNLATKLDDAAKAQTARQNNKLARELVVPKQTAKQKALEATRTTEQGILGKRVVDLTKEEINMAGELAKLPLNPKKSVLHNLRVVHKNAIDEAKNLKATLAKNEVVFPRKELLSRIKSEKTELVEDLILNGNTARQADIITNNFEKILAKHPSTGSGLLSARKEFDSWLKAKKAKVFTGNSEGAFEIGSRRIRNLANDFLDEKATNVAVKDSLRKQSNLFKSVDVMADKAAAEGSNAVARAVQRITSVVPVRGELMQNISALGLVAGAGTLSAPVAIGLGGLYVTGKAGQLVLSPTGKKVISGLIKKTDEAIKATSDKNIIRNLRADRAALIELAKEEESE